MTALRAPHTDNQAAAAAAVQMIEDDFTRSVRLFATVTGPSTEAGSNQLPALIVVVDFNVPGFGQVSFLFDRPVLGAQLVHHYNFVRRVLDASEKAASAKFGSQRVPITVSLDPNVAEAKLSEIPTQLFDASSRSAFFGMLSNLSEEEHLKL